MPVIDYLLDPLHHEFMRRAMIEVVLMGAVTGTIGTFVVLRGLSFIGDALSHAIFPGVIIAFLLGASIFWGALLFGVLTSIAIGVVATHQRVKEDSAIGVLFAGTFALGVVLISSSKNFTRDLASFLFGNVLGVTTTDIWLSLGMGALVIVLIGVFYRELLIASFDRVAAQAMGLPVFLLDLLLLVMISLTIVVSLRAVGNILVVAMLVTPAAAARLLADRLLVTISLSSAIGVASGIVLVATAIFALVWLFAPAHGYIFTNVLHRRLVGAAETQVVFESPEIQTPGRH